MIRIFIGYDSRIPVAYHTACHSILSRSSVPVSFSPVALNNLKDIHWRAESPLASTEFSFSRFLVPYLCNYEGWAIFMDNDVIALDDIAELYDERDDHFAVQCVKHNHEPKEKTKFMGAKQTKYAKKNWSSVMIFNNKRCKELTRQYVNSATGLELHQFKWLENESLIGELPKKWNHLVGYDHDPKPALLHYTEGAPFYPEYRGTEYAREWFNEYFAAKCPMSGSTKPA